MQGQSGEVTCECEGATVCKLKWEKQEDDGELYAAVPESRVTVNRNLSANRVQAILNITNAQPEDSGTYKCNVSVEPNKSDFKLIVIRVKGKLSLIKPFSLRSRRLKVFCRKEWGAQRRHVRGVTCLSRAPPVVLSRISLPSACYADQSRLNVVWWTFRTCNIFFSVLKKIIPRNHVLLFLIHYWIKLNNNYTDKLNNKQTVETKSWFFYQHSYTISSSKTSYLLHKNAYKNLIYVQYLYLNK